MGRGKRATAPYGNRILQTAMMPAGQLLGNPANPFQHSHEQETVLDAMLQEIGFIAHVVVNRRTDKSWGRDRNVETIVDGHLRVQAALSHGGEEQEVPVAFIDVTRDEENALLVSVNPIAMMAGTDREKLDALVAELPDDLRELTAILRAERKSLKTLVAFESQRDASSQYVIVVECDSEQQQAELLNRWIADGLRCKAMLA